MRGPGRSRSFALVLGALAGLAQAHAGAPAALAATCPTPPPAQLAYPNQPPQTATDPSIVARVPAGRLPGTVTIDAAGTLGRVFVSATGDDRLTVVDGRGADPTNLVTRSVGAVRDPAGIAVDPASGDVFVASAADCTISIVRGRVSTPYVRAVVSLDATPAVLAFDAPSHRLFAALQDLGLVVVFERTADGGLRELGRIPTGIRPGGIAVAPGDGRLWIANLGTNGSTDRGDGSVTTFDGRATPLPTSGASIPASIPMGIAVDPTTGIAYVAENGQDRLLALRAGPGGQPQVAFQVPVDPAIDPGRNVNPVAIALLPVRHQAVVTAFGGGSPAIPTAFEHLELFAIRPDGGLDFVRTIPGLRHTTGIALDPVTGRVFAAEREDGDLVVLNLEDAQPPPLAFVLPGPLDVSLAPVDVARSLGLTALLMLLLGLPSTLFNSTLEANLADVRRLTRIDAIQRWLTGHAAGHPGDGVAGPVPGAEAASSRGRGLGPSIGRLLGAARRSWAGLALYLVLIAALHAAMNPAFPSRDTSLLLVSGLAAIGFTTAISLFLAEWYLRRRLATRGRPRVILWTLPLAIGSVVLARISGAQPAYLYGVVGAYAGARDLDVADQGRMTLRGSLGLLALAVGAWVLRIPVQPDGALPQTGPAELLDTLLVGVFVAAVEAIVIGLVPLQFLPGRRLLTWSTWRWAATWAVAIVLFAHVILYPVSDAQPDPSPAGLIAFGLTASAYAAVAVAFWWYFRRLGARRARVAAELTAGERPGL